MSQLDSGGIPRHVTRGVIQVGQGMVHQREREICPQIVVEYHVMGQGGVIQLGQGMGHQSEREGNMSQSDSGGIPRHGTRGGDPIGTGNGASEREGNRSQLHKGGIPRHGTGGVIQMGQGTRHQWDNGQRTQGVMGQAQRDSGKDPSGTYTGDGEQREEAVVYR